MHGAWGLPLGNQSGIRQQPHTQPLPSPQNLQDEGRSCPRTLQLQKAGPPGPWGARLPFSPVTVIRQKQDSTPFFSEYKGNSIPPRRTGMPPNHVLSKGPLPTSPSQTTEPLSSSTEASPRYFSNVSLTLQEAGSTSPPQFSL